MEEEQVYENNYSNIVLSGGGVKGLIHIGVLQILEENNILKNLNKFCGSSIGSLLCLLLNLELNVRDIETLFLCVDSTKFIDFNPENIINLMDNLGCESSDSIENIIKIILEKKTNNPLITFKELYELTGKELTVVGTSIEEYKAYYFNWKNTPDVSVCEGIMISLCVPFIFEPRKYNGKMFVDGGICSNFPIEYFKDEIDKTIGILLINDYDNQEKIIPPTDIFSLSFHIFYCALTETDNMKYSIWNSNIIRICSTQPSFKFDIFNSKKIELIQLGRKSTVTFLQQKEDTLIDTFVNKYVNRIISSIINK